MMKRAMKVVILAVSFVVLFQLGGNAYAELEWALYDDFESGVINEDKWDIDDSSATITIENGRAKFVHNAGTKDDGAWLTIKKRPERITGIKATVTIESGAGSFRGRIGSFIGDYGDNRDAVWAQTVVQTRTEGSGGDRILASALVTDRTTNNYAWLHDLNYSQFWYPISVIAETFVIEMHFNETKYSYSVEGLGSGSFKFPEALRKGVELFKGISTLASDDAGSGTVYFDNVYVLKERPADTVQPKVKSTSPANGAKNVPVDTQLIIKFNEPMQPEFFGESDPKYEVPPGTTWEYEYPSTFIFTFGEPFEFGDDLQIKLREGWFRDAVGNPNEPYSFTFWTQKPPL